jgi:hypothetical protein
LQFKDVIPSRDDILELKVSQIAIPWWQYFELVSSHFDELIKNQEEKSVLFNPQNNPPKSEIITLPLIFVNLRGLLPFIFCK